MQGKPLAPLPSLLQPSPPAGTSPPGDKVLGWGAPQSCSPILQAAEGGEMGEGTPTTEQGDDVELAATSPVHLLPGSGQGHRSPCACPARTHPPRLLMRTSGPGGLQGDMWGSDG